MPAHFFSRGRRSVYVFPTKIAPRARPDLYLSVEQRLNLRATGLLMNSAQAVRPCTRRWHESQLAAAATAAVFVRAAPQSTKSSDERHRERDCCLRLSKYATGTLGGRAGCIPAPTPFSATAWPIHSPVRPLVCFFNSMRGENHKSLFAGSYRQMLCWLLIFSNVKKSFLNCLN